MSRLAQSALTMGAALLLSSCLFSKSPIVKGCKRATGLTGNCSVRDDGKWFGLAAGFSARELKSDGAIQVFRSEMLRAKSASPIDVAAIPVVNLSQLDSILVTDYLYWYSDRGTLQDCLRNGKRKDAYNLIKGDPPQQSLLDLGPISELSSSTFSKSFASLEVKADLKARFAKVLVDEGQAEAAANAAFKAIKNKTDSNFTAGIYRYVRLRNTIAAWNSLTQMDAIAPNCNGASVSQGIVVAVITSSSDIATRITGVDLSVKLQADLKLPAETANKLAAEAQASVEAKIQTEASQRISVSLGTPAIIPLRWKADRFAR